MSMTCKTCRREDASEINRLIAIGTPLRYFVDNLGIPQGSIQRHKDDCVKTLIGEVREQKRTDLFQDVDNMMQEIERVRDAFPTNPSVRVQLIARSREVADLKAKLTGAYIKDLENPANTEAIALKLAQTLIDAGHFTDLDTAKNWLQALEADVGEVATIG